jgi:hypothetical protein
VLRPVIVTKVGRKYFTVRLDGPYAMESEHTIDYWVQKSEFTPNFALYESEQQWADVKERTALCKTIVQAFEWGRCPPVTLETLRMIAKAVTP